MSCTVGGKICLFVFVYVLLSVAGWLWMLSVMRCPSPLSVQSTSHSKSNTLTPTRSRDQRWVLSRGERERPHLPPSLLHPPPCLATTNPPHGLECILTALRHNFSGTATTMPPPTSATLCFRLRRWYLTIPSSDQWWTTIENHRYQWLPDPKTIGKPSFPMIACNHSIQW